MNHVIRIAAAIGVLTIAFTSPAAAATPADSLVIRFANRTRLVIYAPDKAGIQALSNYDLNKIVREMGMQLDSVPGGQTAISRDGDRYLKDTVLVVTKKRNGVSIRINGSGDSTRSGETRSSGTRSDSARNRRDYTRSKVRRGMSSWSRGVDFQIGLNTFLTQSTIPAYPDNSSYELKPLGSRYFAIALTQRPTIINGRNVKLSLYCALEASWNNYMFEENVIARKGAAQVEFVPAAEPLKKSKLTTFAVQLPVVPRLSFYNASNRKVFHLGVGGFVGYRLESYSKIKLQNNEREREHASFYLNNLRYGLVGHLGIVKTNLFVKYDLNPVFQTDKGPNVRALSFGITI